MPEIAPVSALSRSASSKTINGALPPSSNVSFFTVLADSLIRIFPTSVEPVKLTFLTRLERINCLPISSASPVMIFTTPAGSLACWQSSARNRAERGVSGAGFPINVQPAAKAAAILRVSIAIGKFQGVIAATTPIGCFKTRMRFVGESDGIISPYTRTASSANQ